MEIGCHLPNQGPLATESTGGLRVGVSWGPGPRPSHGLEWR